MEIKVIALLAMAVIGSGLGVAKFKSSLRAKDLFVVSHSKFRLSKHDPITERVSQNCLAWISREEGKRGL